MAQNIIDLIVRAVDKTSATFQKVGQSTNKLSQQTKNLQKSTEGMSRQFSIAKTAVVAFGAIALTGFAKSVVSTGVSIENLQVKLKLLYGDANEGAKAFEVMEEFASKVPFSLQDIQAAAGNLAVVTKDAEELKKMLEITGNVASSTGLDFRQAASQMQRSFSSGIASADIFREKGVSAMLGFEVGAKVSLQETMDAFNEYFTGDGEYAKATEEFAKTFTGAMSMIGDKLFQFKKSIADGFFNVLKKNMAQLDLFLALNQKAINDLGTAIGESIATAIQKFSGVMKHLAENSDTYLRIAKAITLVLLAKWARSAALAMKQLAINMLAAGLSTSKYGKIVAGILLLLGYFSEEITNAAKKAMEFFKKMDAALIPSTKNTKKLGDTAKDTKDVFEELREELTFNFEVLKEMGSSLVGGLSESFKTFQLTTKQAFTQIGQAMGDAIFEAIAQMGAAFARAIVMGESFKTSMVEILKNMGMMILEQIGRIVAILIASKIIVILQIIINKVKELGKEIQRTANIAAGVQAGLMAGGPIGAAIGGTIGGFLAKGGIVEGGLDVPSFATGGITNSPQLAVIGDNANHREAVVPLPDGRSIPVAMKGGGVQSIQTLNILPNASIDEALMEKPMTYWVDLVQEKILPALNEAGQEGGTVSTPFRRNR